MNIGDTNPAVRCGDCNCAMVLRANSSYGGDMESANTGILLPMERRLGVDKAVEEMDDPHADCHGCEECEPCCCVQIDADEWSARDCPAHGRHSQSAHDERAQEAADIAAWYGNPIELERRAREESR